MRKHRILVVDDSVVMRRMLREIISEDPDLEVAGVAANGRIALAMIEQLSPDAVTLDIEMPEMGGIEALEILRPKYPALRVIVFSSLSTTGAVATLDALQFGADDYVTSLSMSAIWPKAWSASDPNSSQGSRHSACDLGKLSHPSCNPTGLLSLHLRTGRYNGCQSPGSLTALISWPSAHPPAAPTLLRMYLPGFPQICLSPFSSFSICRRCLPGCSQSDLQPHPKSPSRRLFPGPFSRPAKHGLLQVTATCLSGQPALACNSISTSSPRKTHAVPPLTYCFAPSQMSSAHTPWRS